MPARPAPASSFRVSSRRLLALVATAAALAGSVCVSSAAPSDLLDLNEASPNYANVFNGVKIGNATPETDSFKTGDEILLAAYAYLAPDSPVFNNTAYRDRLFVLLDKRLGDAAANIGRRDIGWSWQAAYAVLLLKTHRPTELSAARLSTYHSGLSLNSNSILTFYPASSLIYDQTPGVLAQIWLNGDIRLAKAVYFGGLAVGDATNLARAEKARAAIDGVMTKTWLADGGTRYVGFWSEVASYHEETVKSFIYWWKLTGSPSVKAALDATRRHGLVSHEPCGFTEQSSNIPYKHMYNNRHGQPASLWKAYLYDDGYNYHYGRAVETATSTELLNTLLYQPARQLLTPPTEVGVFFDGNIQGPRHRSANWGWVVNGRDVQRGGPEELAYSQAQPYQGRMVGKGTLVGAFVLGDPVVGKTRLKGALDTLCMEFKETAGTDTNYNRGDRWRFLTQDEQTRVITRKNFGTVSSTYRVSKRTSSDATADWSAGATPWLGHQLWVLTPERLIGILQVVNDAPATVYGLDTRLVFTGGRKGIMGALLPLTHDTTTNVFSFGELRAKIHTASNASSALGTMLQQRIGISDPNSTDDFSALLRINSIDTAEDTARSFAAAGEGRRWITVEITRAGVALAPSVINVTPGNASIAVLQFTEGARKIRIVQNLTAAGRNYIGGFNVGTTYPNTSLHRSWSDLVTPLTVANGAVSVTGYFEPYGHMIAVNSAQPDDHDNTFRTSAALEQ
ncbi:MAG: hypothetical protein H7067_14620 [Burkholderiales bacterium]|nr:hypothetical protein [Opitutaceae bacterium]